MIDEDQSDCGVQAKVDYEMRLVTNMSTEIQTQLTTQMDLEMATALRNYLSGIFTDYAHDVDLSFYDTVGDSVRLKHDRHIMDANEASYTLNLPMRQYMHLAVANLVEHEHVPRLGKQVARHAGQHEHGVLAEQHVIRRLHARIGSRQRLPD